MALSALRTTSVLAGSVVYLGLAVAGWGGPNAFFAHPALAALALAFLGMAMVSLFVGGNISTGVREDKDNRWVLGAFGVLGILNGFVPAFTDRLGFWTLDGDTVRWVGVVIFVISGALRLWPVAVLGNRFSGLVAIQPGHRLVTGGIYGVIRHPSYLGLILNSLGWSLAFRSGVGVLITMLMVAPLVSRIHAEENLLRSEFGAEYDAYLARTWRLIPGLW